MMLPDRPSLADARPEALLALYADILDELLARGIVRSTNQPLGDYAELLTATALGLELVGNATTGYDAVSVDGVRFQVKARRLTPRNQSRQLSFIRGLAAAEDPFDVLVGVLFEATFRVGRAAVVPISVVRARAVRVDYVNAWRMMLTDAVWDLPGVQDITERLRAAATDLPIAPNPIAMASAAQRPVRRTSAPATGPRAMTQRQFMQTLYVESGYDRDQTIGRYAAAELAGQIGRQSNRRGMNPEAYARALFANGMLRGWLRHAPD